MDGKGSIDNSGYSVITIVQNDDPFGCVGFNTPERITSITADEPKNNEERLVSFNVTRYGGKIGPILVYWKVFQSFGFKDHCIKYKVSINLPSEEVSHKPTVSADFRAIRIKISRNCPFIRNFITRKLGEKSYILSCVFFAAFNSFALFL